MEVGVGDRQIIVAEHGRERVELHKVEAAVRLDELRHGLRPAAHVGQPVDRTEAGVDDIEALVVEQSRRVEDITRTKRAPSNPARCANSVAASMAGPEKSRPVTWAPSRAHDNVSVPMWH
jgi:hypothetical protein